MVNTKLATIQGPRKTLTELSIWKKIESICQTGYQVQDLSYGELLRSYRTSRRHRLSDVAGKAGIDLSYLSRIERGGRSIPSRKVQKSIANALNLNSDEILRLDQAKSLTKTDLNVDQGKVIVMLMNIRDAARFLKSSLAEPDVNAAVVYQKMEAKM